ncbi:hypothetical protein ACXYUI_30410, partial [Klebsiella pneumoniae]
ASFNPSTGKWSPLQSKTKLAPRYMHTAVWTGTDMLIFGGRDDEGQFIKKKSGMRMPLASGK